MSVKETPEWISPKELCTCSKCGKIDRCFHTCDKRLLCVACWEIERPVFPIYPGETNNHDGVRSTKVGLTEHLLEIRNVCRKQAKEKQADAVNNGESVTTNKDHPSWTKAMHWFKAEKLIGAAVWELYRIENKENEGQDQGKV